MRTVLDYHDLLMARAPEGLVDNQSFMPSANAEASRHSLEACIAFSRAPIISDGELLKTQRASLNLDHLPQFDLSVASNGDDLIPLDRGLLHCQTGHCFWSIVFSPGRVWSEADDAGMSRAVLPFQLCNILENDTHHGLLTFLFDNETVSAARFQIVTETAPFMVGGLFDGWGIIKLRRVGDADGTKVHHAVSDYTAEKQDHYPLKPLTDLVSEVPIELLDAMESGFGSDSTIVSGLVVGDAIYLTDCATRAGPYPLPRAMKYGIWSATKTAFATVACARLNEKFASDCRQAKVVDLLPETRDADHWQGISIGDCLNMATGIGTVVAPTERRDVFADYILDETSAALSDTHRKSYDHYFAWFLAWDQQTKNREAARCSAYPWGPGEVVRYRDQDLYFAGAAMDAWLKRQGDRAAKLWDLVRSEVYERAGMHHVVKFETVEASEEHVVPLTQSGLLLTIDNVAKLAGLIHADGRIGQEQLLSRSLLDEVFDPRKQKGLPTGTHTPDGEIHYHCATWHLPYRAASGSLFWLPTMRGYGGQTIQPLPNGMTAFRFAHDSYETEERYDALTLARIADAIEPF